VAFKITVDIVDPADETIKVSHIFWGETEAEARTYYTEHLASCEYFQAAAAEDRVIEEIEEIDDDELPEVELAEDGEDAEDAER
jgi:pyruvate/2-oxoacid:ferredoxin oxidoreductase alpha subunit